MDRHCPGIPLHINKHQCIYYMVHDNNSQHFLEVSTKMSLYIVFHSITFYFMPFICHCVCLTFSNFILLFSFYLFLFSFVVHARRHKGLKTNSLYGKACGQRRQQKVPNSNLVIYTDHCSLTVNL